jgi:Domain of unknown function (DUF4158)
MFFRDQLKRAASLTEEDFVQPGRCLRPHNRLGFAYQVAFVRLLGRFAQQPFELFEELVCFSAAQLGLDAGLIEFYRRRHPTISEHPQTITGYLRLRPFHDAEAAQLEEYLDSYLKASKLSDEPANPLFRSTRGRSRQLGADGLSRKDAWAMLKRRLRDAGLSTIYSNHSFRAAGITNYLENDGTLEVAQRSLACNNRHYHWYTDGRSSVVCCPV